MADETRSFSSSLKWAFLMNWGDRAMSTVFTLVLAAILGPRAFGVVALALVYLALIQLVLEGGVQTALVQREDLDEEHLSSAFWINLAWCLALAGLSFGLAGWWARLNDIPELEDVVKALSLMLVFYGLTIVQLAIFQREMRFKGLAIRENVAVLVGGVLGIVLALRGAGVWALVAQQLGFASTQLVLLWAMSTWRPRLRFSRAHAGQLVGFSSGVFLANLGGFLNRRADALLMGIFFGPVAVGLYRLADRFVDTVLELTMRPVAHVSLPFFSRLQNDAVALRDAVASCIRTSLLVTVPAMLVMAACSTYLVGILGDEWADAAGVLKLLAVVGIGKAIVFFTGPLLFAVARPHLRAIMLWALAVLAAGTVVVVGLLLTDSPSRDQALGMAASRAAFFLAIVIPVNIAVVCWITGLRVRSLLPWTVSPLASGAAGIAAVAALQAAGVLDAVGTLPALLLAGFAATTAAVAALLALEPRARELAGPLVRRALRRRAAAT
ncbi:MAG TPA: lipopolysaccharide biosynthesis protein [Gaiellaceae bacterium]|nr:lipopolysaccharide biosynthesis protein [Gaiellaceae bacterium]